MSQQVLVHNLEAKAWDSWCQQGCLQFSKSAGAVQQSKSKSHGHTSPNCFFRLQQIADLCSWLLWGPGQVVAELTNRSQSDKTQWSGQMKYEETDEKWGLITGCSWCQITSELTGCSWAASRAAKLQLSWLHLSHTLQLSLQNCSWAELTQNNWAELTLCTWADTP